MYLTVQWFQSPTSFRRTIAQSVRLLSNGRHRIAEKSVADITASINLDDSGYQAVGEASLFAAKAGAHPAKFSEALMGGFASFKILEVHWPTNGQAHV